MDKYMKFSDLLEYLRSRNDEARKCGHEETYFDLLTIIDGLKNVDTIPAIPVDWIRAEIKRLRDMDNGFASLSAGQIEAMLKKWREEGE